MLYGRLDNLREQAAERLASELRATGGTPQDRTQRDSLTSLHTERVARYDAVEQGLCFGRLDLQDGGHQHIGRIGLFDDDGDFEPLLLDWRAPAARPFYVATAATPDGVARRRHIRTSQRTVTGLDDELLVADPSADTETQTLTGEAVLLAALTANRTGRMQDIVETIQAEQDEAIRSDLAGVLVVQGGPGTGKTAVALHRAAYLLYTYHRQLSGRGVLIVGPNDTFLRYISQVLPSLAETGVLLATLGDLYPGVTARRPESAAAAELKGRTQLVEILAAAVSDRQQVPEEPILIDVGRHTLSLDKQACSVAREQARASRLPHNLARPIFAAGVLATLVAQVAERIGTDPYWDDPLGGNDAPGTPNVLDTDDLADIRADLSTEPAVQAVIDDLWPPLEPERFLADFYASADALESAAPQFSAAERALLLRTADGGWSPSDVPLLDEAAELLGVDDTAERARAERERQARLEYAQGVLDLAAGSQSFELEGFSEAGIAVISDLMDAEAVAARYAEDVRQTAAAHAAADRNWVFGHVIVDEAQELSPMAWRLLMRRCPSRSMTVAGDLAQTGSLAGRGSWAEIFSPYVADRWRLTELTVSYRTPAEIMARAALVLADIDPAFQAPKAVRSTGVEPWDETGSPGRLAEIVAQEAKEVGDGRLGVIAPAGLVAQLTPALAAAIPELAIGAAPDLERRVVLLTVPQAKGLEFDTVVTVDPDGIVAESPRGLSDLYVALTRATQRLGVFTLS
ncbi:AAA family ATPase [Fodinicola feengrottensis]|uniref:AAA family ATPase n=2 Tax=Fodinicola feengrottensis TaxID=435914 RepID=A0ABN2G254_9ACTN